jgi:kynureninase
VTLDEVRALDAADPLAFARGRFRIPDGLIYLDGNSLGTLPVATPAAVQGVMEREWGEDLITSWNKHGWIDAPQRIAAALEPLLGAKPTELLIADSTSVCLFKLLAAACAARPGRTIILTEQRNFPTDLYVAQGLVAMLPNLELHTVDRSELATAIDEDTAVLYLTHTDYCSGERHDMAALSAAAHAQGALALWDLSHSAGAMSLDLNRDGCDLAVGCGYKYLNGGPGAPAFLFVAEHLQGQLRTPLPGWMGHAEPFAFDGDYRPAPGIARFLTGTPSILALAALEAGIATFDRIAIADIEAKAGALGDLFIGEVEKRCPGLSFASPRDATKRGSQVGFTHANGYAIMQALIARGVIGDFRAPDLMRFGFAPLYNRYEDAWRAADAIADILATGEWDQPPFHERQKVT